MDGADTTVKKTTRTRKTVSAPDGSVVNDLPSIPVSTAKSTPVIKIFDELSAKIAEGKIEFDNLQKEIAQTKEDWVREQKQYQIELSQQKSQSDLERKREEETYQYNTALVRKRAEDEFQDKKTNWEKDLAQRKEELEAQKRELEDLRKQAAGFDAQKEQAVKEAETRVEKELREQFENQRKLREQEVKSEKDLLNMRISNLETDNLRLTKEIEILKRSLDEAGRQVKEIAVKVIESGQPKNQIASVVDKTS